ncbi:MAG: FkbM family methyltransferase [Sphingobacteriia bacterium]|nr:MAG: FkbM family methyltransferase [Sphingobacteriia bacterium]
MTDYLKNFIQRVAQLILGYKKYLFLFAIYQVYKYRFLKQDKELAYFIGLIGNNANGIIIDAGANIGYTTAVFSQYLRGITIMAFEPVKVHTEVMTKLCTYFKLKRVKIHQIALGNKAENIQMVTPILRGVKKQGFSFIKGEVYNGEPVMDHVLEESVFMSTLDLQALNNGNNKILAIKIDVENYEVFVLEGAVKLIAKYQPIVFAELWENERKYACITLMNKYGYDVKVLVNNQLEDYKEGAALNYFFLPRVLSL